MQEGHLPMPPERQSALVRRYAFEALASGLASAGLAAAMLANRLDGVYYSLQLSTGLHANGWMIVLPEGTR